MDYTMNHKRDEMPKMAILSFHAAGYNPTALAPADDSCQAFEVFVRRYEPKLMEIALVFTRVRGNAENIVQDTLRKGFLHLRHFESESSFFTWLTRIAVREAFIVMRKGRADCVVPELKQNMDTSFAC